MTVYLVNPSHLSFGIGVITPRWLFVLAASTPPEYGDPVLADETLEQLDSSKIQSGDVVGIGIHTGNALRGYEVGRMARDRGAHVIYGGIHASLYPEEALGLGGASGVDKGDGDVVWPTVLSDCSKENPKKGCRRCVGVPSIALFALYGVRMVRSLASVPPGRSSRRLSPFVVSDFDSSPWPTTIFTRLRWRI
jgi:hypothetical protein